MEGEISRARRKTDSKGKVQKRKFAKPVYKKGKRNFEDWAATFTDTLASWDYYADFKKAIQNTQDVKRELYLMNSLIGVDKECIRDEFESLLRDYPNVSLF